MAHLVLTELRPTGTLFAGKKILRDSSIKEAPIIKRWYHRRVAFDSIDELHEYVVEMQYDNAIVVRGQTDASDRKVFRRGTCKEKPGNVFRDYAAAFLPFDIDDFAISAKEWMTDPVRAIDEHIVKRLGEPFCRTSYVAQFTGKHGLIRENGRWTGEIGGDLVRVRVIFVTMRGLLAEEAKAWLEDLHDHRIAEIDPKVGELVQVIYVARPKWEGHKRDCDPLGDLQTCWLVKREYDRLPVPDLAEIVQRSRQRKHRRRAENKTHAAAKVADHPDALTAVCSIGLPIGCDDGQGDIYEHLLAAGKHMLASQPADDVAHEKHAAMLRDEIAALCQQHRQVIEENLRQHGRTDDWPLIEHYLEADIDRWIFWLIEHGGRRRHKPLRAVKVERQQQEQQTDLKTARAYCEELSEHLANDIEGYRDQCVEAAAERQRRREAAQEEEARIVEEQQRARAEKLKAQQEKADKRRQREAEQRAELMDWGIVEVGLAEAAACCSVCMKSGDVHHYDVPGCSPVWLHLQCVGKWWKKLEERGPTQIKIEYASLDAHCCVCGRGHKNNPSASDPGLWYQGELQTYQLFGRPKVILHEDCAARHFKNSEKQKD